MTRLDPSRARLCVITDARFTRDRSLEDLVRLALAGGADMIQLRETEACDREVVVRAVAIAPLATAAGAVFLINDRVDVAAATRADGVHLGAKDLPLEAARQILGPHAILGASARSPEQARAAERAGADYLGVGPIYEARGTKPDALEPQGPDLVRRVRQVTGLPILGIGGIDASNAAAVIEAGATGVAVISAIWSSSDPQAATATLRGTVLQALERAKPA